MVKELLSDFDNIIKPSYQPDSFNIYLSMILTIITITILGYGIQTTTANIHTYAASPTADTIIQQPKNCTDLTRSSLQFICKGVDDNSSAQSGVLSSFEQDLHKLTK